MVSPCWNFDAIAATLWINNRFRQGLSRCLHTLLFLPAPEPFACAICCSLPR